MFAVNERHSMDATEFSVPNGRANYFINLAIGVCEMAMISWASTKTSIAQIKAYYPGSEYWRHDSPYDKACYSVATLPFENLLATSNLSPTEQDSIKKK